MDQRFMGMLILLETARIACREAERGHDSEKLPVFEMSTSFIVTAMLKYGGLKGLLHGLQASEAAMDASEEAIAFEAIVSASMLELKFPDVTIGPVLEMTPQEQREITKRRLEDFPKEELEREATILTSAANLQSLGFELPDSAFSS